MIREIDWKALNEEYKNGKPFDHVVIDNFFLPEVMNNLVSEFPPLDSKAWYVYNNAIENKRTLNNWEAFPPITYQAFSFLNSFEFLKQMELLTGIAGLEPDIGLNGGGWHSHEAGGKLNVHLDYSLHPKLKKERRLNLIVYISPEWNSEWGGGLELWSNNPDLKAPLRKEKYVEFVPNRAIIFDTTQNSWHGLPDEINCPQGIARQSMAVYYLTPARVNVDERGKALFAPTDKQKDDIEVLKLIEKRSQTTGASSVYKKK